ncbi:hypothetical protein HG530_014463 [Fusarium avenaceum]|nr:hypothetical protein HG530_014463 [Fusarium avenaceum]
MAETRPGKHGNDSTIAASNDSSDSLLDDIAVNILVLGKELIHNGFIEIRKALNQSLSCSLNLWNKVLTSNDIPPG